MIKICSTKDIGVACHQPNPRRCTMRFLQMCVSVCLCFAVALTAQIPGEQAITNPGFESGDLSGWNTWPEDNSGISVVTDMAAEGDNAAKVSGGSIALYKVVSSEVDIVNGAFYCCVVKVMASPDDPLQDGQNLYLASKAVTPGGDVWSESAKVVTHEDDTNIWHELCVGVHYPDDATEFTVELKWTGTGAGDPGSLYIDDVRVIRMETPPDIINLGLEDTTDGLFDWDGGWWIWSYLPIEPPEGAESWREKQVSRTGEWCLAMTSQDWDVWSDDWWWGGYYSWNSQTTYDSVDYYHEGDNIYMSAWVMTPSDDPLVGALEVSIELTFKDINGENMSNLGYENARVWSPAKLDENSEPDKWHFLEMFLQCPAVQPEHTIDKIDCNIRFAQFGEGWGTAYMDDAFIARGTDTPTSVNSYKNNPPVRFVLFQNYPNPFNPVTFIDYSLEQRQHVELSVYNVLGKKVAVLENDSRSAGLHRVRFDASSLPSDIYFYRLKAGDRVSTKKMILVK